MRNILLCLLLPLFASCGAFQGLLNNNQAQRDVGEIRTKVDDVFAKVDEKLDAVQKEVGESLAEIEQKHQAAVTAADANKDGKVKGWDEQLIYLLVGGGGLAEMLRRKLKGQDEKLKTADERINHEREKRKDNEVAMLRAMLERQNAPPKA